MALDNNTIGYLLDPAFQVEGIAGKPAVGGHIEVFLAGTDSKYISFSNFDGTKNPFKIPLSNDGRAVVLANASQSYDVYFYDSFNNLMFSRLNVFPDVAGDPVNINGYYTRIKNTDDTLDITVTGSMVGKNDYTINTNHKPLGVETPLYWAQDDEEASVIGIDIDEVKDSVVEEIQPQLTQMQQDISGKMDTNKLTISGGVITHYDGKPFAGGGGGGGDVTKAYVDEQIANVTDEILDEVEDREEADTALGLRIDGKQDKLTAGTNITISEDNVISASGSGETVWGTITGNLEDQTDLKNALDGKQATGDYALKSELPDVSDMLTKTEASSTYQTKLDDYTPETWNNKQDSISDLDTIRSGASAGATAVQPDVISDMETKTNAAATYQTKLTDYTPETWNGKQDKLTAGTNVTISDDNVISFDGETGKTYTGQNGVEVDNDNNKIGLNEDTYDKLSNIEGSRELEAGTGINIDDSGDNVIISSTVTVPTNVSSFTNDAGYLTEHQSLEGLATEQELTNGLAGKQDTLTDYTPEVWNNKQDALTDYTPNVWNSKQDALTDYTPNVWNGKQDKLTAGSNITISEDNVISATGGSGGKTYTGVSPVVVDNDNDTISVTNKDVVAGSNITISEDDDEITIAAVVPTKVSSFTNDAGYLTQHQDISGLATKEEVTTGLSSKQDTISDLETIRNGANAGSTALQPEAISDMETKTHAGQTYQTILTDYTPSTWNSKQDKLTAGANITISEDNVISATGGGASYTAGDHIDISDDNVISATGIPTKTSELSNDSGFLTSHQSLEGYATEQWVENKGYLTEHQSLEGLATEQWVEGKGYLTEHQSLTGYATENWVENKGYLTEHQSLAGYALKSEIPDTSDMATKTWVEGKGYLTEHQDISGKQNKLTDVTDIQLVNSLPASPVATVLYLIPEA